MRLRPAVLSLGLINVAAANALNCVTQDIDVCEVQKRDSNSSSTTTSVIIPSPVVIPASEYWDGVDGQWSSFALRVGTPPQDVRVLISTNSPEMLTVLPLGCTAQAFSISGSLPSDCTIARGGTYNYSLSSTWQDIGTYGINADGYGWEADLGYAVEGEYGLETVGLGYDSGISGPTLENQLVAGIAQTSPFYLGVFGLGTQPVNFTKLGNSTGSSFFSSLRSQNLIPGMSWSYTAGAKYQLKDGQYGQLIFGGYDSSRFTANSVAFTIAGDINRDIVVGIQSITYAGTTSAVLLDAPIFAFIESTDPNIWLPQAAVTAFETAFGLVADNTTGLYLINQTQYASLSAAKPEVTFTLANSLNGGATVNIVLPFTAFALQAAYPFTPNSTYYFPLKVAKDPSQYTLGRVFLQEAYLTVDYDRGNFSVSQCEFVDGAPQELTAILSPSYSSVFNSTPSTPTTAPATHGTIKVGAIVGIVVAVLFIIGGSAIMWYLWRRRNKGTSSDNSPLVEHDEIALGHVEPIVDKPADGFEGTVASLSAPSSPYPMEKPPSPSRYFDDQTNSELDSGEIYQLSEEPRHEIHQLSAGHDELSEYTAAVAAMHAERRAANTPELPDNGIPPVYQPPRVFYEMPGSEVERVELDAGEWGTHDGIGLSSLMPRSPPASVSRKGSAADSDLTYTPTTPSTPGMFPLHREA